MLSINHPASPEFKIALLRHYISCAFIDLMVFKHGQAVFIEEGEEVVLTLDKVALNIIYHIEAPFIERFGVMDGGQLAAADLMAMLMPGFMAAQVQLSPYGYHRLCEVYRDIIFGAPDGELPPGSSVCACNVREAH
ncbi:hypothetical protein [Serratia fonticola]|uniref:hypothetical protein n=1 Tax=Serratia fonticola TaxID=47917 RepID=UPI00093F7280|nr:hypothetical protein [Serratia fonticola]OKP27552.1 hypothetical protein BSQ40_14450 [Serratia fonticola]